MINNYAEGTVLDLSRFVDTTSKDTSRKFIGWFLQSNGGAIITQIKVTSNLTLYPVWVDKDPMTDWNPTFVQGNATNLASEEVYGCDGIKTYNEISDTLYCKEAGKGYYLLTKQVYDNHSVDNDWAFLNITSAIDSVSKLPCDCSLGVKIRPVDFDPSTSASYKK